MHAGDFAPAQQQTGVQDCAVVAVRHMQLSAGVWYIELLTGMLDWHATLAVLLGWLMTCSISVLSEVHDHA
jgi:hypothetical protein